jgi:DUF4097 and DUF4098 domain-containing protein YvlB
MTKLWALTGLMIGIGAPVWAQGDRVVIPERNTSRPRQVNVSLVNASITVKTHSSREVIVELQGHGQRSTPRGSDGLRRLDLPAGGLEVTEEDNVIEVKTRTPNTGGVVITAPANTSLTLKSTNGEITVEGIRGEIDANSNNGSITLTGVSGTVVAHSLNGEIRAALDGIDQSKPLSFSTLNGQIDVTLPASTKANVKFKADRGEVYTDFEIALAGPGTVTKKEDTSGGRYRVQIERVIQGTINGGGVEVSFYTLNGRINLRKK